MFYANFNYVNLPKKKKQKSFFAICERTLFKIETIEEKFLKNDKNSQSIISKVHTLRHKKVLPKYQKHLFRLISRFFYFITIS